MYTKTKTWEIESIRFKYLDYSGQIIVWWFFVMSILDNRDLAIEAGIQLIPNIGGSLATIYFGAKQERRFKRIEQFYKEVAQEIGALTDRIASIEEHDTDALAAIIEEVNEKVEREQVSEKWVFFKTYLKNTLIHPVKGNFDERRFFLDTLGLMSLLECEILGVLYNQDKTVRVRKIQKPGVDQYAIVGATSRLKSYGFLVSGQGSFTVGGGADNMLDETIKMSNFGRRFCDFCLRS